MRSKHFILLVLALLILSGLAYLFLYVPTYHGSIREGSETLVFAHRGFGNHAPDNSLKGAELAMRAGMDGVDMDAQLTSDGQIVVFHDLSVDRLTDAEGKVSSKTLAEMESLDLAPAFATSTTGAPVHSFEDFVKAIPLEGILMTELKVTGFADTGIEKEAIRIISKYDAYDRVYLSSFNPLVLWRLKHIDPRIHTVLISMDTNWNPELLAEIRPSDRVDLPWFLRNELIRTAIRKIIKPDLLSINNEVDEHVIDRLIKKGYPVFLWTVDDAPRLEWALAKKPYGVISDEPQLAKKLRDESR